MKEEFGVLYVATGKRFISEATESAKSLNQVMPEVKIILWTDEIPEHENHPFYKINLLEKPTYSFFDKIIPLCETPFQKTLFVDTDTYFLAPVNDLIPLLERFDLTYCHAPWRICPGENNILTEVPSSFPEPNTGVIAYRSTKEVFNTFRDWERIYDKMLKSNKMPNHDQPAFRLALWKSDLNTTVLPSEYNIRTIFPVFVGGNTDVKILHGREPTLGKAKKEINQKDGIRIYNFKEPDTFLKKFKRKLIKIHRQSLKLLTPH